MPDAQGDTHARRPSGAAALPSPDIAIELIKINKHFGPVHANRDIDLSIRRGEIDPSYVITHRATLEEGPDLYRKFRDKQDNCIKVVMRP